MGLPIRQDEVSSLIKEAQALVAKKDDIEAQLRDLEDTLQGVGMDQPLIDRSGFPRSDIDVAAIRTSRNLVHRLRNDHKDVMKEIEQALHKVHQASRDTEQAITQAPSTPAPQPVTTIPFALVNAVAPDSPADASGLRRNDKVVRFGHVHAENHERLQALNRLVGQSENKSIQVMILRDTEPIELTLIPRQWSGRGTLGCHIVPL